MRIPALVLALALLGAAAPADAAFDTWTFPGAPLPFKLDDVGYARADRRDAVIEAVRGMALEQLRESGVFRANAPHGVRVDLRDVTSTANVEADGSGTGRAEILYRVTSDTGAVLFNDRVVASARVGVAESVGLQQSTDRAARYRAFVRNLETFALRFWQTQMPTASAGARIDAIALSNGLETPERTADFTNRVRTAVDVLLPQARPPAATPLVLKIESLDFSALAPAADRVSATVKLGLVVTRPNGTPIWRDATSATAEAPRRRALAAGVLPIDAALADATQAALAKVAPEIAAAMAEAADLDAIAVAHRLPYSLADIVAGPKLDAPDVLQRLRRWNQADAPLSRAWSAGAPPLTVRLDAAAVRVRKTGQGEGVTEVTATYTVFDAGHAELLTRSYTTRSEFSAADAPARGATGGEWAVRVGLRDNWAALLDALAALPGR